MGGFKASAAPADPFATLDARKPTSTVVKDKGKKQVQPLTMNEPDTLVELETEFLVSKSSK